VQNKYELVFILRADLPEGEMESRVERTKGILANHQGEITKQDHWGVRRLAYEIQHETKGNYMLLKFHSSGDALTEIDRSFRQDDLCLRHLIVRDEEWEERNRAAMAKQRAKQAAASDSRKADA
jgi:small subunit ribosomal protein S6